jgi:triacylglycerol esterase/lipase EstA (alpha/beta hydrolase family)
MGIFNFKQFVINEDHGVSKSSIKEVENERFYKVDAQVELIIPAENEGEAGYLADSILASIEYGSEYIIDNIDMTEKRVDDNIKESKSQIKSELENNNDYQMVSGIIDILKKVKDKENRMEIAKDMISQFKREDIKFDYDKFLDSIK